tara:strand:- start:374 stop:544 length:171 start_codon:yes stop_codon:yes gene_type:complete
LLATADDGSLSSYIDLDQIRIEGGFIHFWIANEHLSISNELSSAFILKTPSRLNVL